MSLPLPAKLRASLLVLLSLLAFTAPAKADEAVVLVQLNEYNGPEAYFHLYLVNPEGKFDRTLWVSGPDKIWWPDSKRWFGYHSRARENIDGITGASTAGGARSVMRVDIDPSWVDAGYKLRVETSVENADNVQADAEIELTKASQRAKTPGTGYVRYIRYKL
ncbi:DUF2271 domain-containing protein [Aliamphritea hakodatensis]|uniref:DUF2271 domain-containing protein n=1 Tax=Aliamphritea hakodatensis TaxID=2895352 RepID=UPI0022FD91B4|nr:DUF2271 domain-containing protein [Aliamphritea hakodatensis]